MRRVMSVARAGWRETRLVVAVASLSSGCTGGEVQAGRAPGEGDGPARGAVQAEVQAGGRAEAEEIWGQLPLRYEENRGQHDARARYVARQGGVTVFVTDEGPVVALRVPVEEAVAEKTPAAARVDADIFGRLERAPPPSRTVGLALRVEGAREGVPIEPSRELVTKSNYFIGDDPAVWRTNVPNYGAVTYRGIQDGLDLVLHGSPEGRIEYDFVVAPGRAPDFTFRFEGADCVAVAGDGTLELHTAGGVLRQPAPVLYQERGGARARVEGAYGLAGDGRVRFAVGEYDRSAPLVIDPVLEYSTYLGGSGGDEAHGVAVDGAGAVYVTGSTSSWNFPTENPLQAEHTGTADVFVAKLSPEGDSLLFSTYLGGTGGDRGMSIAVDGAGAAYVTGLTSSVNFPTERPLQAEADGLLDAFVAKLSPGGDSLVFSTYLAGSDDDLGYGIAIDGAGAAYVTGTTWSPNFPMESPMQAEPGGDLSDAFVAKLSPEGSSFIYSTYLGGSSQDEASGIAVDAAGAAYVTGSTSSRNFPTVSALQPEKGGDVDVFVAKLSPEGDSLAYSTYLGGSRGDFAMGIAIDADGTAYVTGGTDSTDFPTKNPLQAESGGEFRDVFVAKVSAEGDSLVYSTYLAGSGRDWAFGIAADGAGAAYVAGTTQSLNFPTEDPLQAAYGGGNRDAFVAKVSAEGDSLVYSTYLGGSGRDWGNGIAVDGAGAAYVAGMTQSLNFPTESALQAAYGGGSWDAFVAKIAPRAEQGMPCTAANKCKSGHCVDGVCCDAPCTAPCEACAVATGAASDGACSPTADTSRVCRPGSGDLCDPDETCDGESPECPADVVAAEGTVCRASAGDCDVAEICSGVAGAACPPDGLASGGECRAASCSEGVETLAATCDGISPLCPDAVQQSCGAFVCGPSACTSACSGGGGCAGGFYCELGSSLCLAQVAPGAECAHDDACASGHCVDGVCCDAPCTGQCEACDLAGLEGTCSAVTGEPRGGRPGCASDGGVCGGECDGELREACAYPGAETACRQPGCEEGVATLAASCAGNGSCPVLQTVECAPNACAAAACAGDCGVDDDCADGAFCAGGVCVAQYADGTACAGEHQCASGHCVDGYCCESGCEGQCEACDVAGEEGACVPVTGAPHGGRAACASDGSACAGECDGASAEGCAYPDVSTSCGAERCVDGAATALGSCNGDGSCSGGQTTTCSPYGCGADACLSTCAADGDCAGGFGCAGGECVARSPAPDAGSANGGGRPGGPEAEDGGADAGIAAFETPIPTGGCSCRFAGHARRDALGPWALVLLGAALGVRRTRRVEA